MKIFNSLSLLNWNSLLLEQFFISKLFLQTKIVLLFKSVWYFSQNFFFFFSKHFCRNWFGKREAIFFLWYTEIHNCRNNSLSQNYFCNWSFCFAILFCAVFILEIFLLTRNISAEMCISERDYIGLVIINFCIKFCSSQNCFCGSSSVFFVI